jgi:hypothetical protein
VPAEIEHEGEDIRPDGEDDRVHAVPALADEIATVVPAGPESGVKVRCVSLTVNWLVVISPASVVSIMV